MPPLSAEPLVTIIMPSYNNGRFVEEAMLSALGQSYTNIELIVVDDSSTDDSSAIVERMAAADARVHLVRNSTNLGFSGAMNAGFSVSSGEIICQLDSDDILVPTKVERVVCQFQAYPNAGTVLHRTAIVDAHRRKVQELPPFARFEDGWLAPDVIRRGGRWLSAPGACIAHRRAVATYVFPIPEELRFAGSHFRNVLPVLLAEVKGIDEVLYEYRIHGDNFSGGLQLGHTVNAKHLETARQVQAAINIRLAQLDMPERAYRLADSLSYQEMLLTDELFTTRLSREMLREYTRLILMLIHDDMSGPLQRTFKAVVYSTALVVPRPVRSRWLGATLGYSRAKELLGRLLRRRG